MATPLTNYITYPAAARLAKCDLSTIHRAVQRGELSPDVTGDGELKLLRIDDVKRWMKQVRRPGRKPKAKGGG